MRLAAMFLWLALPLAGWASYAAYGLPHMIWSYRFLDNGRQFDPFADRYYTSCTFIGWYGTFTRPAEDGRCPWLHFFKEADQ